MRRKDQMMKLELILSYREAETLFGILLDWDEFLEADQKTNEDIELYKVLHEVLDKYLNTLGVRKL